MMRQSRIHMAWRGEVADDVGALVSEMKNAGDVRFKKEKNGVM